MVHILKKHKKIKQKVSLAIFQYNYTPLSYLHVKAEKSLNHIFCTSITYVADIPYGTKDWESNRGASSLKLGLALLSQTPFTTKK